MKPDVVVDVGNSRTKWGRCGNDAVREIISLSPDDLEAWQFAFTSWELTRESRWAIAGVHPARADELVRWLRGRSASVVLLNDYRQLPLEVRVDEPAGVGLDRLLNAVAARRHLPAVVVDAGTAVTVDLVDATGAFLGGSIFPGLHLMARALCDHTAMLPFVEIAQPFPSVPGRNTRQAIRAGVYYAVAGGINTLIHLLSADAGQSVRVFLTGGDSADLRPVLVSHAELWPEMTLEGLRLAAEGLP